MLILCSKIAKAEFGKEALVALANVVAEKNYEMIEENLSFSCHCILEAASGPTEVIAWIGYDKDKYTMLIRLSRELEDNLIDN